MEITEGWCFKVAQPTNKEARDKKMKEGSVAKLTLQMAFPAIVSMLTTTIYNMADTYFVSKVSTEAIAAVGVSFSFMSIVQAFGFLYGHGSGNYLAKMLGSGKQESADEMAGLGMFFSVITGGALAIICLLCGEQIARFLGAHADIQKETVIYLKAITLGIPFMAGVLTLNSQLRFQGNAFYGMIGNAIGGLLNIILDAILILGLNKGIAGAGIATAISQIMSFVILVYLNKRGGSIRFSLKKKNFSQSYVKPLIWGGMPNFSRQAIAALAAICLNTLASKYGAEAIAAFTVVNRLIMISGSIMIGFGQGFQPICAYNYGARLYERVKKAFFFAVIVDSLYALVMMGIILPFAPELLGIFSKQETVLKIGIKILRIQSISFPILGWVIVSGMFLQNIGRFKRATLVSAARQGICFFPLAAILPYFFGLWGIALIQPSADIGTFLIALPLGIQGIRDLSSPIGKRANEKSLCNSKVLTAKELDK